MLSEKLEEISSRMRSLDICMMSTISASGDIVSRPMSNNGDVAYEGNSFFFTYEDSNVAKEINNNNSICLNFEGRDKLYISIQGKAKLIKDKSVLKQHWKDDLSFWFKEGLETPGIVMIAVKAEKIKYWYKMEMKEINL